MRYLKWYLSPWRGGGIVCAFFHKAKGTFLEFHWRFGVADMPSCVADIANGVATPNSLQLIFSNLVERCFYYFLLICFDNSFNWLTQAPLVIFALVLNHDRQIPIPKYWLSLILNLFCFSYLWPLLRWSSNSYWWHIHVRSSMVSLLL